MRLHALGITDTMRDDLLLAARRAGITVEASRAEVARLWKAINKDLGQDDILVTGFALSGVLTPEVYERALELYTEDPGRVEGRPPPKMWATSAKVVVQYPDAFQGKTASLARRLKEPVGYMRQSVIRVALHLVRSDAPKMPVGVPLEVRNLLTYLGTPTDPPSDLAVRTANAILAATEGQHPTLARETLRLLLSEWDRVQKVESLRK